MRLVGCLAQLVRAPRLHRGCRGFESLSAHKKALLMQGFFLFYVGRASKEHLILLAIINKEPPVNKFTGGSLLLGLLGAIYAEIT